MKNKIFMIFLFITVFCSVHAEKFRFKYTEGSKFRILSEVDEEVYFNGVYLGRANILNKISFHIERVEGNRARLNGKFQISERSYDSNLPFRLTDETDSVFWRDKYGKFDIEAKYYMPVVRNVPLFPEREVKKGESWTAEGHEVHDLRNWGMLEPFVYPIFVNYKYLGKALYKGKEYDLISVNYNIFFKTPRLRNAPETYPLRISGYSEQRVYWDNEAGRMQAYTEDFDIIFDLLNGETREFTGTAKAEYIEAEFMDTGKVADDIKKDIEDQGIRDAGVRQDDDGVTITLSNIQFPPDSALLIDSEQEKLYRIAEILKKYPDRDIRISGHTALAGTEEGRNRLSLERAEAVGSFLLDLGVRKQDRMIINGLGASQPVADNATVEGMKKNRRVEITILEN